MKQNTANPIWKEIMVAMAKNVSIATSTKLVDECKVSNIKILIIKELYTLLKVIVLVFGFQNLGFCLNPVLSA
jgi:hypothetical protein